MKYLLLLLAVSLSSYETQAAEITGAVYYRSQGSDQSALQWPYFLTVELISDHCVLIQTVGEAKGHEFSCVIAKAQTPMGSSQYQFNNIPAGTYRIVARDYVSGNEITPIHVPTVTVRDSDVIEASRFEILVGSE